MRGESGVLLTVMHCNLAGAVQALSARVATLARWQFDIARVEQAVKYCRAFNFSFSLGFDALLMGSAAARVAYSSATCKIWEGSELVYFTPEAHYNANSLLLATS